MATHLTLKLLIDNRMKRVVFAEAGKDVVDFLFRLLAMPLGLATKLLTTENMAGSMGSIYKSVESLDDTYMQSNQSKSALLNHPTAKMDALFLIEGSSNPTPTKCYRCDYNSECRRYYTDVYGTHCPYCRRNMAEELRYASPQPGSASAVGAGAGESAGFVKGLVTYTVMDDLSVMPMSSISSITLLEKFNVNDLSSLEERTVDLGMEEALELLRVSLQSKMVLTAVFLGTKTETTG